MLPLRALSALLSICRLSAAAEPVAGDPLFFTGAEKASATAQLLRVPAAAPELRSADGATRYEAGKDFRWEPGSRTLTLTAESRVPFKTTAELYPAPNAPHSYKEQRGTGRWMFFGPHGLMHTLQCAAAYDSTEAWRIPFPAAAPAEQLGPLRERLRARQPLKLVMLGDSISTGADASALSKHAPQQPGYPVLVEQALEKRFRADVTLANLSVGGMDSAWGLTRVPDVLKEKPDLLLLAFGMNDASGRRTPEDLAGIIQKTAAAVREALPSCTVILVTSMTANAEWIHSAPELYPRYATALTALAGPHVAVADVTAVWTAVAARKKHMDLSGNGLNHPNDFGHRLYADTIMAVIGGE